ncbi:MAG: hypothetical protein M1819_003455 [Sarea resinae]|nr:MAG: hypothetical protein M1819_003455 [Sarea resinae]
MATNGNTNGNANGNTNGASHTNGNGNGASSHNVFLIWGGRGYLASYLKEILTSQGKNVQTTTVRMEDRAGVLQELESIKPTHVFNCAGLTGRPNVDWCEDNKEETIRSNVIGTVNLADCCFLKGVHLTTYATGCEYPPVPHPIGGKGFVETDEPNFDGSFYSKTKALTEKILVNYPNSIIFRVRMPVSDDLHARSFVTKIAKYERVVDVPNSQTIFYDLLPASIILAEHNEVGVYNFTNPGAISHNEVLSMYKQYLFPDYTWKNFSLEEQGKILKAGRSNCTLDSSKLVEKLKGYGYEVPDVHAAYEACFKRIAAKGAHMNGQ